MRTTQIAVRGALVAVLTVGAVVSPAGGAPVRDVAGVAPCERKSRIAYTAEHPDGRWEIHTIAPDGTGHRRLTNNDHDDVTPAWSPDGRRLAWGSARDGDTDLWTMNADASRRRQLTDARHTDVHPAWSPDGRWIAFASSRADSLRDGEHFDLYVMRADGTDVRRLTRTGETESAPTWSPDSRWIAFERTGAIPQEIYKIRRDGTGLAPVFDNLWARGADWSPNTSRLALQVEHYDRGSAVYTAAPDGTRKTRITRWGPYQSPSWGPSGGRIAFTQNWQLSVMDADGSRRRLIRNDDAAHYFVDWGPRVDCTA